MEKGAIMLIAYFIFSHQDEVVQCLLKGFNIGRILKVSWYFLSSRTLAHIACVLPKGGVCLPACYGPIF